MSVNEKNCVNYVVIFEAELSALDEDYLSMAENLRLLATGKYGCLRISSVWEGGKEITLSYWNKIEQIEQWKADREHQMAQQTGRDKLFSAYQVTVAKVEKQYEFEK